MKRAIVPFLAMSLAVATAPAIAQSAYYTPYPDRSGNATGAQYDYARVIRVQPVYDAYNYGNAGRNCYEQPQTYAGNGRYGDGYSRNDGYYDRGYADDRYGGGYDPYARRTAGTQTGATVATVIGGVVGAVVGSKVGGGSARYATSALGSMVGGIAGRQIYDQVQRQRQPATGTVRVCDAVPVSDRYPASGRGATAYDVTYEYAGRQYTTRTDHHPGDRIRVRVDVRPD